MMMVFPAWSLFGYFVSPKLGFDFGLATAAI
jgi:hypothetical protein